MPKNLDSHTFLGVEVWEVGWHHSVWTPSSVNATVIRGHAYPTPTKTSALRSVVHVGSGECQGESYVGEGQRHNWKCGPLSLCDDCDYPVP
jgi:hypothetical protein